MNREEKKKKSSLDALQGDFICGSENVETVRKLPLHILISTMTAY